MGIGLKTICFALVVIFNQYKHTEARGPECLKCDNIDSPTSCTHVVRCQDHEQCFVHKYITDDGHTFFNVGCKDNQVCVAINQVGKRESKEIDKNPFNQTFEDSFNPTVVCEACCQSDLCNADSNCGSKPLQHAGKLLCYSCGFLPAAQKCNTITMCSIDELCFYEHTYHSGLSNERKWAASCKKKLVCDQLGTTCERKCCNTDICNSGCASSTTKHCVSDPADIVFLLDESGSIGPQNFDLELNFIAEFAQHYTIGPNDVQMGVITFNTQVRDHFKLKNYANINDLTRGIRSIHYHHGGTRTDLAIDYVVQNSFSPGSGARSNVPHFLIVISDGNSNKPRLTEAAAIRLHQTNINTFAVGVGHVNLVELNTIASSRTNHVFTVNTHLELKIPLKAIRCPSFQNIAVVPSNTGSTASCADSTLISCNSGLCGNANLKAVCPMTCGTCPAASCKDNPLIHCIPTLCAIPNLKAECPQTCGSCNSG